MKAPLFIKNNLYMAILLAAAFIATLFFTFEPLFSATLSARTLPSQTIAAVLPTQEPMPQDILSDASRAFSDSGANVPQQQLLSEFPIESASIIAQQSDKKSSSISVTVNSPLNEVMPKIRFLLAKQKPTETKTILPDGSYMIEIVIDPGLMNAKQTNTAGSDVWTISQTNPQFIIKEIGSKTMISVGNQQVVDNHGFAELKSCELSTRNNIVFSISSTRHSVIPALFNSFLAYFKYYSCFQSFSTIK
jgi:hypothetical protein